MAQPYIGQIIAVGFNFTPLGWLPCNGQLIGIAENQALFMLIGTTYGGDGQTTFGIPNLNGRVAIGSGQGPGRTNRQLGEVGGSESVTLAANQAGAHAHSFLASAQSGTTNVQGAAEALATNPQSAAFLYAPPPATVTLSPAAIAPSAGGQPHENRQPYLGINYVICAEGIFPSQS